MKLQMAVFITDSEYGARFVKYLRNQDTLPYEIVYFNQSDQLLQFLEKQRIEILLTEKSALDRLKEMELGKYLFILTDESYEDKNLIDQYSKENMECNIIYKYQSMEAIISLLQSKTKVHSQKSSNHPKKQYKTKYISLITMEKNFDAGRFAYLVALQLNENRHCLYFSLSQFEDLSCYTEEKPGKGLSDLIYYIKSKEVINKDKLQSIICRNKGVDYINCVNNAMELPEILPEDMDMMVEVLEELYEYDMVVVELSFLNEAVLRLLKQSDYILLLHDKANSEEQMLRVKKQICQLLSPEETEKLQVLALFEGPERLSKRNRLELIATNKELKVQINKQLLNILEGSCEG